MLMAAGLGARLRPFTQHVSKPLIPLMGVPMAQFSMDALGAAGVKNLVANVHYLPDETEAGLRALACSFNKFSVTDESSLLLGSAGGIKKAEPHFEGRPFFIMNADVICSADLLALARHHEKMRNRWGVSITLTIFKHPPTPNQNAYREIYVDPKTSLITGFGVQTPGKPFYVGVAVVEKEALENIPLGEVSEFVPMILEPAIRAGKAAAWSTDGLWFDVGSPELWLETHIELIQRLETGAIPALWRNRIEKSAKRIAAGIWTSRQCRSAGKFGVVSSTLQAPMYFENESVLPTEGTAGPRAVLYSKASGVEKSENVLTFSNETKAF